MEKIARRRIRSSLNLYLIYNMGLERITPAVFRR